MRYIYSSLLSLRFLLVSSSTFDFRSLNWILLAFAHLEILDISTIAMFSASVTVLPLVMRIKSAVMGSTAAHYSRQQTRTFLFPLTTHSIAPYHAHVSYRTPKPDTTCDRDLNLYNRLSRYCQWLRYQQDLIAFNTLYSLLRGTI